MKPKTFLLVFIVAGLLVRAAMIFSTKSYLHPELFEYEDVIRNLLAGKGFVYYNSKFQINYYAAIHPLFTFLCAVVYAVTNHSFLAVEIFQVLVSVATGYLICLIGNFVFDDQRTSLLAAALTIFHPGQVIYSTLKIQSPVIDTFFFVLAALLILRVGKSWKMKDFVIMGILIGLGSLARGTLIICLPIAAIYYSFALKIRKTDCIKKVGIAFIFASLVMSPWWIRNFLILGKPIFMTTESAGYTLWVGFNEKATGTLWTVSGNTQWDEAPAGLRNKVLSQKDEMSQQNIFRNEALSFIAENPSKSMTLYIKRLFYFWWFTPTQGNLYPKIYFEIYKIYYKLLLVIILFSLFNILFLPNSIDKNAVALIFSIPLALSLVQGLCYIEGRHRWEIEPLLLLFAAHGIRLLFLKKGSMWHKKRRRCLS